MKENEQLLLSENKFLQQKQLITPCKTKICENYQLQTPNIQRVLFTNHKNLSASKFFIDEEIADQQIQQIQIDQAMEKINFVCTQQQLKFQNFSIVQQDLIRLLFLFDEIKMICTYPIEKLFDFLKVVSTKFKNSITLILSTNKLKNITVINDINQLREINSGLVGLTYSQLYRRDSETVLDILKTLNIKQAFYLDDIEQCRYLLSDNIKQHIVCNRGVLPAPNIQDLKNQLSIKTTYIGPTLDVGYTKSQYVPNYQLNKVIFLDLENYSRILMRLQELDVQKIALKFSCQKSLDNFQEYCLNNQITCNYTLINSTIQFQENQFQILVHIHQLCSLQEYLNDVAFLNKDCINIVYLSKEQYLDKRKSLYFQQTDIELLSLIFQYLIDHQPKANLNNIKSVFYIDNPLKIMNILEKHQIIQIENILPLKCSVSIDLMADTNSEQINQLIKYIKLNSRRLLSLRKEISRIKHYQIDLNDLSQYMKKSIVDLCVWIESLNHIFIEPEFFDYQIIYNISLSVTQSQICECSYEITQTKKQQINELDIWFCLGQMLKQQSLSKCANFYSNQEQFAKIVDKYFTTENKQTIGELFQYNHQKYLPIQMIEGQREKNKIIQDIRNIFKQQQTQSYYSQKYLIPIKRKITYELLKLYKDFDQEQIIDLIQLYLNQQIKSNQQHRIQGWIVKNQISKRIKLS